MTVAARALAIVTDAWGAEGGIAQYNRDFISALARSEVVSGVDVLAYTRSVGVPDVPMPGVAVRSFASRASFVARCLAAPTGYRFVFCGHLHLAPVAAWAARRARSPLWLQMHGIEAWPRPSGLRRAASERASLVTTVSRYTRSRVCSWSRIEQRRVRVLPNTVDTSVFDFRQRVARRDPLILSVGRLAAAERYKGHDRVISLLPRLRQRFPGLRYRIVGDGDDRARLVQLAQNNGSDDAVEFAGFLPRARLPEELRAATLFAMPSTGEGFGIAFVEALACGTPSLGLDCDGSRDALGDGELGVVSGEGGLCEAIESALDRSIDAAALSRLAIDRYSPERFGRHVDLLARELLSG